MSMCNSFMISAVNMFYYIFSLLLPIIMTHAQRDPLCPADQYFCATPLDYAKTRIFECHDNNCPPGFRCCPDNCYHHRVCKEQVTNNPAIYGTPRKTEELSCPPDLNLCSVPFNLELTKIFICRIGQCAEGFKCCSDSCYLHKVCKKVSPSYNFVGESKEDDEKEEMGCPIDGKLCKKPLNREETKDFICVNGRCPQGFKCCSDSCFSHKICKIPKSTTQTTTLSTILSTFPTEKEEEEEVTSSGDYEESSVTTSTHATDNTDLGFSGSGDSSDETTSYYENTFTTASTLRDSTFTVSTTVETTSLRFTTTSTASTAFETTHTVTSVSEGSGDFSDDEDEDISTPTTVAAVTTMINLSTANDTFKSSDTTPSGTTASIPISTTDVESSGDKDTSPFITATTSATFTTTITAPVQSTTFTGEIFTTVENTTLINGTTTEIFNVTISDTTISKAPTTIAETQSTTPNWENASKDFDVRLEVPVEDFTVTYFPGNTTENNITTIANTTTFESEANLTTLVSEITTKRSLSTINPVEDFGSGSGSDDEDFETRPVTRPTRRPTEEDFTFTDIPENSTVTDTSIANISTTAALEVSTTTSTTFETTSDLDRESSGDFIDDEDEDTDMSTSTTVAAVTPMINISTANDTFKSSDTTSSGITASIPIRTADLEGSGDFGDDEDISDNTMTASPTNVTVSDIDSTESEISLSNVTDYVTRIASTFLPTESAGNISETTAFMTTLVSKTVTESPETASLPSNVSTVLGLEGSGDYTDDEDYFEEI